MSDHPSASESTSVIGILLGTAAPTVLAMLFGGTYVLAAGGSESFLGRFGIGVLCGLSAVVVPAFGLAWHATSVRQSGSGVEMAGFWGLIPAAIIGGTLGPALGGVAGYQFGLLQHGITIGMFGWVAGPLAWEVAFWSGTLLRRANSHTAP